MAYVARGYAFSAQFREGAETGSNPVRVTINANDFRRFR